MHEGFDPLGWLELSTQFRDKKFINYDDLRIPSLPAILNNAGIKSVEGPRGLNLRWSCCGLYEVIVNRGSLESELPASPKPLSFYMRPLVLHKLERDNIYMNPFSWDVKDVVPLYGSDLSPVALAAINGARWSRLKVLEVLDLESLRSKEGPATEPKVSLQPFSLVLPSKAEVLGIDVIRVLKASDFLLARLTDNVLVLPLAHSSKLALRVDTSRYDIKASVLYPFAYFEDVYRPGDAIEANSVVLRQPRPLSISSSSPIRVEFREGYVNLELQGVTYIGEGDEPQAIRQLLQLTVGYLQWSASPGFVSSGSSSAVIYDLAPDSKKMGFVVINPTRYDSELEARLNREVVEGSVCSSIGCYPLEKSPAGLLRVPAPRGCYCFVTLTLGVPSHP
ncbi:hypothetical protein ASAC_0208 [Acidilobus saccharovorans 345-15]|uniref:Uncharacterized protein n=1 Tax=Acidilobus saccharovorans (strain DSM 16705 / JCM 18335 / VKM B-2471 / 345-15) TaxID=666510 RepID=D9PZX7_ACIS3|nr:hypothetical protein ASAC_0208 [Acidilobus saccharovorans 345-15]